MGDRRPSKDTLLEIGERDGREGAPQGLCDRNRLSDEFRHWEGKANGLQSRLNRSSLFNSGVPGVLREALPYPGDVSAEGVSSRPRGKRRPRHGTKKLRTQGISFAAQAPPLFPRSPLGRGSRNPWPVPALAAARRAGSRQLSVARGLGPGSRRPGDRLPLAAAVQLWSTALNRIPSDALPYTKSFPP